MNQHQYTAIFQIGAKLLGTFDSSMRQAQARLKALQHAAKEASGAVKLIASSFKTAFAGLAAFAVGSVFKKIFEGAFEEAAEAQERALALTNEFYIHMKAQGREAAEGQVNMLLAYNKELAKTGVISHKIYDTMAVSLSKLGEGPRQIAELEPVLADVLVRARGIRASSQDASDLADTLVKVAKGGRQIALMKFGILLGPSERERLKAYKDDWRGALNYLFYFLKTYKGFNEAAARTPLGQIQRMRNSFEELSEEIGATMLPAQADMAAAWEKALPAIKPVLLGALEAIARVLTFIVQEVGAFYERIQMPDAVAALQEVKKAFVDLLNALGIDIPEAGLFGRMFGAAFIISCKLIVFWINNIKIAFEVLRWILSPVLDIVHLILETLRGLGKLEKVFKLLKTWLVDWFLHPVESIIHRLEDLLALLHIIKHPSRGTAEAMAGGPTTPADVEAANKRLEEGAKKYKNNPALLQAYLQGAAAPAVPKGGAGPTPAYAAPGGYGYGPQTPPPPPRPAPGSPYMRPVSRPPITPAMPTTRVWGMPSAMPTTAAPAVPPAAAAPPPAAPATPAYNLPAVTAAAAQGAATGAAGAPAAPTTRAPAIPITPAGGYSSMLPPGATMPYGGGAPYGGAVGGAGFGAGGAAAGVMPATPPAVGGGGGGGGAPTAGTPPMRGDTAAAAKAQAEIASAAEGAPASLSKQQQKGAVLYGKLLDQFRAHPPPVPPPPDAARFGIVKGTPEEWARWGVSVAHAESGFNPKSTNLTDPGGSFGVFQYAHGQAYGNAYDVDNSVRAFVRDANAAAAGGSIRGSTLAKRFSTIGNHPDVGTAYLAGAQKIAQASAAQATPAPAAAQPNAPPPLIAAMQHGGIARLPMLATLAERGPEAVLPLSGARGMLSNLIGGGLERTAYNLTHSPTINIHGGATDEAMGMMEHKLKDAAMEFIRNFKAAQRHERRLSYESGYGS